MRPTTTLNTLLPQHHKYAPINTPISPAETLLDNTDLLLLAAPSESLSCTPSPLKRLSFPPPPAYESANPYRNLVADLKQQLPIHFNRPLPATPASCRDEFIAIPITPSDFTLPEYLPERIPQTICKEEFKALDAPTTRVGRFPPPRFSRRLQDLVQQRFERGLRIHLVPATSKVVIVGAAGARRMVWEGLEKEGKEHEGGWGDNRKVLFCLLLVALAMIVGACWVLVLGLTGTV
jgi:hypothetical protein